MDILQWEGVAIWVEKLNNLDHQLAYSKGSSLFKIIIRERELEELAEMRSER